MEAYMDAKASTCSCGCGCRSRVVPGVSDRPAAQPEYSGPSTQMWPGWDMNQGGTVWPIVNCPDTTAGYLEQHHPVAMAYVPWQQWQTAYAPERGLMQGTIFPDLDLPFNYGRCGR